MSRVEPAGTLVGHIAVPGDKSISHRAVLIGALADGETHVRGLGRSADTQSTIDAVRSLGVQVDDVADDELVVHGVGLRGLQAPDAPIDAGNAGTLMRLLPGSSPDRKDASSSPATSRCARDRWTASPSR